MRFSPRDPIHSYEIEMQNGLLNASGRGLYSSMTELNFLQLKCAIIADETVAQLYGNRLLHFLASHDLHGSLFSFPGGEIHKTRETKERLENQLFERGYGKDSCVIGLGGGITTDIAGYLAATYCRGIPLILIPTSLLGMVDASIGGKTGVNVPWGKNLVGALYHPAKVLIDPDWLLTLPIRELKNGIVEVIKHALIADASFFTYLESHSSQLLTLEPDCLYHTIFESCRIKTAIVEQDVEDKGKRRLLNFGHTVGHALETASHYSLSHGEAVALGMLIESRMALQMGYLSQPSFDRIYSLLLRYGIPLDLPPSISLATILEIMSWDKKSMHNQPRFVLLREIGYPIARESSYCFPAAETIIQDAFAWISCSMSAAIRSEII